MWYNVSEWLGAVAMATAFGFIMAGLFQLVTRRSIWKVDVPILVLGAFYGILAACYAFFEVVVINYRPVILTQGLKASYPSSHTMASICIMVTALTALFCLALQYIGERSAKA